MQEPPDDEERELMDSDNWDWDNPIEGVTVGNSGAILPIRFTFDEYQRIFEAVRMQRLTSHEFIRRLVQSTVAATAR